MTLKIDCVSCHRPQTLPITAEAVEAWRGSDELIQDAFPQLQPGQREMLLSGVCDTCWDAMFAPEADEPELPGAVTLQV